MVVNSEADFAKLRGRMVCEQINSRGIEDVALLEAFKNVPRHLFVPSANRAYAYEDRPVSIGEGQTISQPYIVALMTQLLKVNKGDNILEIGTGSGYQAAILAYLEAEVFSVERISLLAGKAKEVLSLLGYKVKVKAADGTLGWQEYAPYDKIIVTAAAPSVCASWIEQLKPGGILVAPLGGGMYQDLTVINKDKDGKLNRQGVCGCVFVPLIGEHGRKEI